MAPTKTVKSALQKHPFLLSIEDVAQQLGTNIESGLSAAKVQEIQRSHPPNELEGGGGVPWYKILLKQCSNAMILVCGLLTPRMIATNNDNRCWYLPWP
jgi:Na+-exporting ATPase